MAVQLSTTLDPSLFEVEIVSLYGSQFSDLESLLRKANVPVQYLDKHPGFDRRIFAKVCRVVRRFRPHVLHTHMHAFNYAVPVIVSRMVRYTVHTVHSIADRERQRIGGIFPHFLFGRSVTVVAIGREVQASILRVFGTSSILIPNGVPLSRFQNPSQSRSAWRKQEGFTETDVLLTSIGRFDAIKNHSLLLDAFAKGPVSMQGKYLLLAGTGQLEQTLRAQAKRLGIAEQVIFLGLRQDVPEILAASDAFVFASDSEGSPLSVMESMAVGLPVCGTAVGGIPELVETEREGILVAPRDIPSLAYALTRICTAVGERHAMGKAAAAKAARFDIRFTAEAYGRLYGSLVIGKPVSSIG
jgi:glycosyltransferase involved in cell wall biosynthesis